MNLPHLNKWTPSDAAGVNQFLGTPLGQKWLEFLQSYKPRTEVTKGTDTAALTGAYNAGYEFCMLQIYTSCQVPEEADFSAKTADMTKD